MARRRRGRGRRRRGRMMPFVTRASLRRAEHGAVPRGRFDPPDTIVQPWNRVVLNYTATSDTTPYVANLATVYQLLIIQLGLKACTSLRLGLRFERIDVWSQLQLDTGMSNIALAARMLRQPGNIVQGKTYYDWYRFVEDRGTLARPAHCHWIWPSLDSTFMIDTNYSTLTDPVFKIDGIKNVNATVHLHVMWRGITTDPVPSYRLVHNGVDPSDEEPAIENLKMDETGKVQPRSSAHFSGKSSSLLCCCSSSGSMEVTRV